MAGLLKCDGELPRACAPGNKARYVPGHRDTCRDRSERDRCALSSEASSFDASGDGRSVATRRCWCARHGQRRATDAERGGRALGWDEVPAPSRRRGTASRKAPTSPGDSASRIPGCLAAVGQHRHAPKRASDRACSPRPDRHILCQSTRTAL